MQESDEGQRDPDKMDEWEACRSVLGTEVHL